MQLGIDFGTTHTIVAAADRGNYPVVAFFDDDGDSHPHFPSVAAIDGDRVVYGFDALTAAGRGAPLLRSFKRVLATADVNAESPVLIGDRQVPVLDLLTGFLTALRLALVEGSNLDTGRLGGNPTDSTDSIEAVIAVPAHAHGAQRFLTLESFRRAGFAVTAMINEPSAAGFEYTQHRGATVTANRTRIVVYDLGGGTFDASLVAVDVGDAGASHTVLGTSGINRLGGDDFDDVLLRCALDAAGSAGTLTPDERADLREQCRDAKERLTPQSRRIVLEIGDRDVTVPVDDFYRQAAPLVEDSLAAMEPLLGSPDPSDLTDLAGIYLVGGGSGLPLVPRLLRERFGRRVFRSPQPAASTAIGLAIAADPNSGFLLADRLSRGFGVFREREAGRLLSFDPILLPDTATPASEEVVVTRNYRAAHNVGRFRFVECSAVDDAGEPRGDLVPFAEVIFPFDPALQTTAGSGSDGDLAEVDVRRVPGPEVRERYTVDRHGLIGATITDLDTGYERSFSIGRSTAEG